MSAVFNDPTASADPQRIPASAQSVALFAMATLAEHDIIALLGKRFAGLNARVVEFAALADHNGTGTNEEDFFDRRVFRHGAGDYANPVPQGNEMVRLKIRHASEQKYGTTQIQHRHQGSPEKTQR
jgi:hypothetical protein